LLQAKEVIDEATSMLQKYQRDLEARKCHVRY